MCLRGIIFYNYMLILHILNLNARAAVELERAQSGRANIKHFLIHTLTHTHTHRDSEIFPNSHSDGRNQRTAEFRKVCAVLMMLSLFSVSNTRTRRNTDEHTEQTLCFISANCASLSLKWMLLFSKCHQNHLLINNYSLLQ